MLLPNAFCHKNILILGYGVSGQSAVKLLQKNNPKNIFVYDKNFLIKTFSCKQKCNKKSKKNQNKIIFCKNKLFFDKKNIFFENNLKKILNNNKIHFCIISPGISKYSYTYKYIKNKQIRILSELEFGAVFTKGKIFAITGTNGKTTTANILHHIFLTARKQSFLCGNVGTPLSEIAPLTTNKSLIVCEVSSFQLETSKHFFPYCASILNLQPDHIDRHKNFKNYSFEKEKIFSYFKTKKIINFDDKNLQKFLKKYKNIKYFSLKNNKFEFLIKNNNLLGIYNLSNLTCAVLMAKTINIKNKFISTAISTFQGLPNRLNVVKKIGNITFINDSKSTNIASTISALDALKNKKIILLLGGSDKNLDFSPLKKFDIFSVIGFGETAEKIEKAFSFNTNFERANHLEDAFAIATEKALKQKNEVTILLSPASASFDEFTSYSERGKFFENLVKNFSQLKINSFK